MIDVEINNIRYRSTAKLNAMDQLFLTKRLVPVIDVIVEGTKMARSDSSILDGFVVLADGIARLKDEDCVFVLDKCLTGVQTFRDNVWSNIWNSSAKQPQFFDVEMPTLLQLTFAVIMDNLGSFLPAPEPSASPAAPTPANGR